MMGVALTIDAFVFSQVTARPVGSGWFNCSSCNVDGCMAGLPTVRDKQAPSTKDTVGGMKNSTTRVVALFPTGGSFRFLRFKLRKMFRLKAERNSKQSLLLILL